MDEEKVRTIFFKHLKDHDPSEAIAETYREISENILAQTYEDQVVEKSAWELLLKIVRGMARVNLYLPFFEQTEADVIAFGPNFFDDISFFFQTWRDGLSYTIEHFDELMSDRVKAAYSADHLRSVVLAGVDMQITQQAKSIALTGSVMISKDDIRMLTLGLTWSIRSIMTSDRYLKFADEFNSHLPVLKMYYMQIVSPPGGGGSQAS